jgi:hypothetical protein
LALVQTLAGGLLLAGVALAASGIAVLAGPGWTLIFLGVCSAGLALLLARGLIRG